MSTLSSLLLVKHDMLDQTLVTGSGTLNQIIGYMFRYITSENFENQQLHMQRMCKNVQKLRSTNFKLISPWHIQTQKPVSETLQQFLIFNLCVCHFSTYLSSFRTSNDKKQIYYILKDF